MNHPSSTNRPWKAKFADAFRGIRGAIGGSSFTVHRWMAIAVVVCGVVFQVDRWEWCILLLCIAIVMAAETFNSAIESLSLAVDRNHNPDIGRALDMASGAVLICAIAASLVGCLVFVPHALTLVGVL